MLKMENVTYQYPDQTIALHHINMDLGIAKRIGIIGSNGAGKSTLFLNFTGFLKPSSGAIHWRGKPLSYGKKDLYALRKEVGIVFQDPEKQIFFSRVYDDVAFGPRNLKKTPEEVSAIVASAMEQTRIALFQEKPVHFLSGGQKKNVAIAGMIAMDANFLFFDEPTADLDFDARESVKEILNHLVQKDKTIILSSHDMDFIYEMCDYVYVIKRGEVLSSGIPSKVFMDQEILQEAALEEPLLIKAHRYLGAPLFKTQKELFENAQSHVKS